MFGGPGAEILYPDPGFPPYRDAVRSSGAKAVPYPIREEKDFGFDAEEVLSLITPATRLIIINSPANPTGGVVSREEITKLAHGLAKHPNVAVLSDEIYSHQVYDGVDFVSFLSFPELRDRTDTLPVGTGEFAVFTGPGCISCQAAATSDSSYCRKTLNARIRSALAPTPKSVGRGVSKPPRVNLS